MKYFGMELGASKHPFVVLISHGHVALPSKLRPLIESKCSRKVAADCHLNCNAFVYIYTYT